MSTIKRKADVARSFTKGLQWAISAVVYFADLISLERKSVLR